MNFAYCRNVCTVASSRSLTLDLHIVMLFVNYCECAVLLWVRSVRIPGSTPVLPPVRSNSFDAIPGAHPGQPPGALLVEWVTLGLA